jgi:hypothetical protein
LCKTRSKILNEITTKWFNQLDHVLLDCKLFPEYFSTSFRNHTTDHYAIVFRLPLFGNKMSESFLENMNYDGEHWTKVAKRKRSAKETTERSFKKPSAQADDHGKLKCLLSPNWLTSDAIDMYINFFRN